MPATNLRSASECRLVGQFRAVYESSSGLRQSHRYGCFVWITWFRGTTCKRTPINLGCFRAGSLCSTEWDNKVSICTYRCIGAIKRSFTFFLFFASPLWCVRRSLQLPSAKKCTLLIDFSSSSLFSFIHTLTFTGEGSSAAVVTEEDGIHFLSSLLSPFLNFYPNLNPILINYLFFSCVAFSSVFCTTIAIES